jgi:hypothetical protein
LFQDTLGAKPARNGLTTSDVFDSGALLISELVVKSFTLDTLFHGAAKVIMLEDTGHDILSVANFSFDLHLTGS